MLKQIPDMYKRADLGKVSGVLLAVVNLTAGLMLTGISGWFITTTALTGSGVLSLLTYNLFLPGALIRMLAVGRPLIGYAERLFTHRITLRLAGEARVNIFKYLLNIKKKELVKFRSTDLAARITGDVAEMDNFYLSAVLPWLSTLIVFTITALTISYYLPLLTWAMFLLLMTCGALIPYISLRIGKKHELLRAGHLKALQEELAEYLDGLKDLELFGCLGRYHESLLLHIRSIESFRIGFLKKIATRTLITGICIQAFFAIGILIISGPGRLVFSSAEKVLVILILLALYETLYAMPETAARFARTLLAGSRILLASSDGEPARKYGSLPQGNAIQLEQVNFAYGRHCIFDKLSLKIHENTVSVITGVNGAGKSTLLDLIAGLQEASQGMIYIGGTPARQIEPAKLNEQIAYMEQRPALFEGSIFENIALAKTCCTTPEVIHAAIKSGLFKAEKNAMAFLKKPVGTGGRHLSTGQSRMIALARIILKDAPIILLDEPTEGLSQTAEHNFLKLIRSWKGYKTILIVTHKTALLDIADHRISL
ncbi:amino acid ABC transporter ATP-binding/permease protein [Mucilaginibacter celer]|nr:ATP-binding cassette domain-containing protein [Mucilaginibacter celer]